MNAHDCHRLDTENEVFFYENDFYVLSNFSAFQVIWRGIQFPTSEHAYHWSKFTDEPEIQNSIRFATSAHEAMQIARRHQEKVSKLWNTIRTDTMIRILRCKVNQHEYVRRKLMETGDRKLIEDSWRDDFWGWGPNRDGANWMGKLWMQIRDELGKGA